MKWFKVDVDELIFPDCSPEELIERLRIRALCAHYEEIPPDRLTKNNFCICVENEFEFIKSDIKSVVSHRKVVLKSYKRRVDDKADSKTDGQFDSKTDGADKIRLDKIRLDKTLTNISDENIDVKILKEKAEKIYHSYPTKRSNGTGTGKTLKDKGKIYRILKEGKYPLEDGLKYALKMAGDYVKNLSTQLNQLPDPELFKMATMPLKAKNETIEKHNNARLNLFKKNGEEKIDHEFEKLIMGITSKFAM